MSAKSLSDLIQSLHHAPTTDTLEAPFLKYGTAAFDLITSEIERQQTGTRFLLNALYVLFCLARQTCFDRFPELFDVSMSQLDASDIRVRSFASILATRIAGLSDSGFVRGIPSQRFSQLKAKLNRVCGAGLSKEAIPAVQVFFASLPDDTEEAKE